MCWVSISLRLPNLIESDTVRVGTTHNRTTIEGVRLGAASSLFKGATPNQGPCNCRADSLYLLYM